MFDVLIDYLPVNRFNMLVDICQQLPAFGAWLPFSLPHLEEINQYIKHKNCPARRNAA